MVNGIIADKDEINPIIILSIEKFHPKYASVLPTPVIIPKAMLPNKIVLISSLFSNFFIFITTFFI